MKGCNQWEARKVGKQSDTWSGSANIALLSYQDPTTPCSSKFIKMYLRAKLRFLKRMKHKWRVHTLSLIKNHSSHNSNKKFCSHLLTFKIFCCNQYKKWENHFDFWCMLPGLMSGTKCHLPPLTGLRTQLRLWRRLSPTTGAGASIGQMLRAETNIQHNYQAQVHDYHRPPLKPAIIVHKKTQRLLTWMCFTVHSS